MSKYYKKNKHKKNKGTDYSFFIILAIGIYITTKKIIPSLVLCIIPILLLSIKLIKKAKLKKKYLDSGIDIVDNLSGLEFEEFLLAHFHNMGYKGNLTPTTNDYGADLILKKDGEKIVVQAKRYSSKVGIEAIQQIIGAKAYYKASKALVITNNLYTPNALNLALSADVELWDRHKLLDIMSKVNAKEKLIKSFGAHIENKRICKKCGSDMKTKNGRYGDFYGCTMYPNCNYTEKTRY